MIPSEEQKLEGAIEETIRTGNSAEFLHRDENALDVMLEECEVHPHVARAAQVVAMRMLDHLGDLDETTSRNLGIVVEALRPHGAIQKLMRLLDDIQSLSLADHSLLSALSALERDKALLPKWVLLLQNGRDDLVPTAWSALVRRDPDGAFLWLPTLAKRVGDPVTQRLLSTWLPTLATPPKQPLRPEAARIFRSWISENHSSVPDWASPWLAAAAQPASRQSAASWDDFREAAVVV